MTDADDPFGLMNDAGRTRIRPASQRASPDPGRGPGPAAWEPHSFPGPSVSPRGLDAAQAQAAPSGRPVSPEGSGALLRRARAHPNPLVAAFAPLLEIAPELERATAPPNAASLRVRLLDGLIQARDAVVGRGVALTRADQAAWFVAALIDDLAMNTPWGGHSDWPRQPLVVSLAGDVDAGSRFFDRLSEYQRYPERDPEMLELAHVCLGLGFRGRFRVEGPQAQGALLQARTTSFRLLRNADADRAALSPNWEGVNAPDVPRRFAVPLWTIGLATVAVAAAIHVGLALRLSQQGDALTALALAVPPPERASIFRPVRESLAEIEPTIEAASSPPVEPVFLEMLPLFEQAAPSDTAGALTGREDVSLSVLVVRGTDPEVFRSARADVNEVYLPLIAAIGRTIVENGDVIGGVTVIGHTDSEPVQASNPFASNQGLSEARAQTIARLLAEAGVPYELLQAEGRADSEPVADNGTREGRAQNRRVEIRIEKRL